MKKSLGIVIGAALFAALIGLGFVAYKRAEAPSPAPLSGEAAARDAVLGFGRALNQVALLAPDAPDQIERAYALYASPELIAAWKADPERAPGRLASSPWPDHIDISSMTQTPEGAYRAEGAIALRTSGGDAGAQPVSLTLASTPAGMRIIVYSAPGSAPQEPSTQSLEASIGKGASALGIVIDPIAVLEDSRCPRDVQCIQAGTVRVSAKVTVGTSSVDAVLRLGTEAGIKNTLITLVEVAPAKDSKTAVDPADYRFTFRVVR
jgi:hypothetical protein